jgi:beta-lactamase regulating signal transducer with metallopeptidase domain
MQYLLFEFAIRATLIAAGTAAVLGILRVKSAAARHSAWVAVLVLMMLVPLWTAWGPKASLRVLPAVTAPVSSRPTVSPQTFSELASPVQHVVAASPGRAIRSWPACLACIYFLGVSVLLARLAIGAARAHMLVRRAANRGGRLTSESCAAPITVGWLTPTVILPKCWEKWPKAQLDAVLTHEGEHARRRDPLVQWLALLNRAVFWFHPLAWWLERKLSALAEEACDAAVLARGHDPFKYSEYLLEMARSVLQTGVRVKVLGMAMPGSFLPQRIRRILEGRPAPRISRGRMVCLAAACAMVSALFATGVVDRRKADTMAAAATVTVPPIQAPTVPAPVLRHRAPAAPPVLLAQIQTTPPALAAPRTEEPRIAIYFDLTAMPESDQRRLFGAARSAVSQMQSGDVATIFAMKGGKVETLQDFTNDKGGLLRTLDRLAVDLGPEGGALYDADKQEEGLLTVIGKLALVEGKKDLRYFTVSQKTAWPDGTQAVLDAAKWAGVTLRTWKIGGLLFSGAITLPPGHEEYTIGAEDVLQISVALRQGISGEYAVRPNGTIAIPRVGALQAPGLTIKDLQKTIGNRLDQPWDTVEVTVIRSRQ